MSKPVDPATRHLALSDLRKCLDVADEIGVLEIVEGADPHLEMGTLGEIVNHARPEAPALLFEDVPGYPKGYRTLYGQLSSIKRIALTLGLPLEHERKVDIVQRYHARMAELKPLKPRYVNDGPIFENVITGDLPSGLTASSSGGARLVVASRW